MSLDTLNRLRAGQLAGLTRLDLSCELTELPEEVFALADTLEVLNLSHNRLRQLPDLSRLHRLKVLFCSDNDFTEVPGHLGAHPSLRMVGFKSNRIRHVPASALPPTLRWLILTANEIESLPDAIGLCTGLEKVALAGNRLRTLPESMAACRQLGLLRISANDFHTLPGCLLTLPKLAWLAYGGNPCEPSPDSATTSWHEIPWSALSLGALLGEGASGHIHAATWQGAGADSNPIASEAVAVKLFKGALTSDGLPDQEMQACLTAGAHPHLIPVHGVLQGHPEGRQGLVMPQLDAQWRALAGPPSLDSCTRDVYAPEARWSMATAWRLAQRRRTCTRVVSCMAICTRTTSCGAQMARRCWGTSAPHPSCLAHPPQRRRRTRCSAWTRLPSATCWKSCCNGSTSPTGAIRALPR